MVPRRSFAKDDNTKEYLAGQVTNDAGVSSFEFAKSLAKQHTSQHWNQFVSRLSPVEEGLLEDCCKK